MKKKQPEKFYTPAEAARYKGITRQAVNDAIKRKALPAKAKKVTRIQWLISAKDLEAYEPSGRHQESGKKISDAALQATTSYN